SSLERAPREPDFSCRPPLRPISEESLMRIVVCVKHVPDVQADRKFRPDGRVDRTEDDGTLNELDEHALEAGLVLAEEAGGQVVVLTMGPPAAETAVRRGLQVGASQAVHVVVDAL